MTNDKALGALAFVIRHLSFKKQERSPNCSALAVGEGAVRSDQLEERFIEFSSRLILLSEELPKTPAGRHIALQILRSGTSPAPNYAEARGAESRADFIHKLGIVQKELNETSVWLRVLLKNVAEKPENIVAILAENRELARIIAATIRTAKAGLRVSK
jgi:four helix bundle protein